MKIDYFFDSALLVSSNRTKILVDGLINDDNYFDKPGDDYEAELFNLNGDFVDLDALIFTHCHGDHFSDDKAYEFACRHPQVKIILPTDDEAAPKCIEAAQRGVKNIKLFPKNARQGTANVKGISMGFYKTGHISPELVGGEEHYCLLLSGSEGSTLITGDFEPETMPALQEWTGKAVDNIFVNPLVIAKTDIVKKMMFWEDSHIYVYHMPQKGNDRYGYRKLACFSIGRAEALLKNCLLLDGRTTLR